MDDLNAKLGIYAVWLMGWIFPMIQKKEKDRQNH